MDRNFNLQNWSKLRREFDGLDNFVNAGFADTFREKHPSTEAQYSWWSYRAGARKNNVGWRIDYFLASPTLVERVSVATIYMNIMGSDHCPVGVDEN